MLIAPGYLFAMPGAFLFTLLEVNLIV